MASSTKLKAGFALGKTREEKDLRVDRLREMASLCGFRGRYGGNPSAMLCAIADLSDSDFYALAYAIEKILKSS